MERDGLERHGELGAAELVRAVMADDHVLQPEQELVWKRFAGQLGASGGLLSDHLHAHDEVSDELSFVGVGESAVIRELVDLADVVEEDAGEQQVAIQLGVEFRDPAGDVQEVDDVFDQTALVCVVVLDAGGCHREFSDEFIVDQKALGECSQVGIVHPQQHLFQPCHQLGDVLGALR
jgi:hypothetical protein